jgi:hypothetical protein
MGQKGNYIYAIHDVSAHTYQEHNLGDIYVDEYGISHGIVIDGTGDEVYGKGGVVHEVALLITRKDI